MNRRELLLTAASVAAGALMFSASAQAGISYQVYDNFDKPGYSVADYSQKWANTFGPGELAVGGTRDFSGGRVNIAATPFRTGSDFSVFDHLKYIAVSTKAFPVPTSGTLIMSSDIKATTPGTVAGLMQNGVYGPSGSWLDPANPPMLPPYQAKVLQGQQAGAVMNAVDFCSGQLFDWFIAGSTAFTLIERLPTNVTGNTSNPNCPGATYVGRDKMYTQIVREVPVQAGVSHHVDIAFTRSNGHSSADYFLDYRLVSHVDNVGIPLDKQGVPYTGTYPSLGPGEQLANQINSLQFGHGLFSLLDAFPFQHPESPGLSVSIPVGTSSPADAGRARLFGQGATGSFDNFTTLTVSGAGAGGASAATAAIAAAGSGQ
jgi:hypothetical protein